MNSSPSVSEDPHVKSVDRGSKFSRWHGVVVWRGAIRSLTAYIKINLSQNVNFDARCTFSEKLLFTAKMLQTSRRGRGQQDDSNEIVLKAEYANFTVESPPEGQNDKSPLKEAISIEWLYGRVHERRESRYDSGVVRAAQKRHPGGLLLIVCSPKQSSKGSTFEIGRHVPN
ncbi:hypothetical protein TNCV_1742781 [Trichonephila clavipes]|nr:hypothetical protein TNCV_1742781 [Trichonephila clavipes]